MLQTFGVIHCTQIDGQVPGPQHIGTIVEKQYTGPGMDNCFACLFYEVIAIEEPNHPQGSVMQDNFLTAQGCPAPPTQSGCDPSAWSNHSNWISNWTNSGPFNSSNPNQPCNHICGQLQNWTNNLSGAGSVQTNQLNCKIDEGNNQAQIHNCNC